MFCRDCVHWEQYKADYYKNYGICRGIFDFNLIGYEADGDYRSITIETRADAFCCNYKINFAAYKEHAISMNGGDKDGEGRNYQATVA